METLTGGEPHRVRAFRAADTFALEAWQAGRAWSRSEEGSALARELRRVVARSAGALVGGAAALPGDSDDRASLRQARAGLLEARYYLYLGRRLALLDLRRYRQLTAQHDAAIREIEAAMAEPGRPGPRALQVSTTSGG